MISIQPLIDVINHALNRYLQLDPESSTSLKKLAGKRFTIDILPFHLKCHGEFTADTLSLSRESKHPADVVVRGTPMQLVALLRPGSDRRQSFADHIVMEGDAEVGSLIIQLFDHLEIDWEEQLARLTGDASAHHLGNVFRRARHWFKQADNSLTTNLRDYLHEEAEWLPAREALNDFFNDIDALRMDTDRIEARISQLSPLPEEKVTPS